MKAILMLEDGEFFLGKTNCKTGERIGEVFFDTRVVGYQEAIADPANADKILFLTYHLIGNYGCSQKFNESQNVWLKGLVIKEKSPVFSNWQAKYSFDHFIRNYNLLTIEGLNTCSLAV